LSGKKTEETWFLTLTGPEELGGLLRELILLPLYPRAIKALCIRLVVLGTLKLGENFPPGID
jgi:hypothetical protein